jgi:hypothetical protein
MVKTAADLDAFMRLPYRRYEKDPQWVPPLFGEIQKQFDPQRNPFLDHCEYSLFLLRQEGHVTGRVAAFIDTLANRAWNEPVGLFWVL